MVSQCSRCNKYIDTTDALVFHFNYILVATVSHWPFPTYLNNQAAVGNLSRNLMTVTNRQNVLAFETIMEHELTHHYSHYSSTLL